MSYEIYFDEEISRETRSAIETLTRRVAGDIEDGQDVYGAIEGADCSMVPTKTKTVWLSVLTRSVCHDIFGEEIIGFRVYRGYRGDPERCDDYADEIATVSFDCPIS